MSAPRHSFVVFSDDWGRHPSSGQHLFRRIARDHRVLWVNTLGLRSAKADRFTIWRGLEKLGEWTRPLRQVSENMWVLSPIMLPLAGQGGAARLNAGLTVSAIRQAMRRVGVRKPILWASLPTAMQYVGRLGESAVVYYVTDDYALWPGGNADLIRQADRDLTAAADLIFPCNRTLCDSHRSARAQTVLLPHAVDFEHFARDEIPEPADLRRIGRPRACFFGLVYEKIDLPALAALARARPDTQIVLLGPVATDVSAVERLANVHVLGPRPYQDLPAYLAGMDALLVPYILDDETANKGPLKIRECLAAGKPTVARAIADLQPLADLLTLYDDPAALPQAVDQALARAGAEHTARMRDHVRSHTWAARVEQVLGELARLPARGAGGRGAAPGWSVEQTSDAPDWRAYLAGREDATIYHDPAWGRIMRDVYGNRPLYLTLRRAGQVAGVLPLVYQQSAAFGAYFTSLPYFDAVGALADDQSARDALLAACDGIRRESPADWLELRHDANAFPSLPCRTDKVTFRLPLPADPEELWTALKAKVRNQVRKARRADLTAEDGGRELLGEFHAIYLRTMRDLGSPPHCRRFFEAIARAFGPAVRIFVVRQGHRTLAASLTLRDRLALRVPWAGADWRYRDLNANMLLYWTMLAHGCAGGARAFDFGRSTRDAGTYRFKKQWGADECPLYWHYLLPPGAEVPQVRHDSAKYRLFVAAWRRLPTALAERVGPALIAKLS